MSNYTQTTFFAPKDALLSGNPAKIIFGAQVDPELAAIAAAIATKYDSSSIGSGQVPFGAGSASAPSITFSGGTNANTGLYLFAANSLGFAAGGLAAGSIASTGSWSIGGSGIAQNLNALTLIGNSTSGQSLGLLIKAGTTFADSGLQVTNQSGASTFLQVFGNGEMYVSTNTGAFLAPAPIGCTSVGFLDVPFNNQGAPYQLQFTDRGKLIDMGGTVTIPANGTTAFPVGTTIMIYNGNGVSESIAITTDTLTWIPSNTGGAGVGRTLAAHGLATIYKVGTTTWLIWGFGLS